MSKAFRTIKAAIDRKKNESWNFDDFPYSDVLDQDDCFERIVEDEGSSPAKLEPKGKERGKGRISATSEKKRQKQIGMLYT